MVISTFSKLPKLSVDAIDKLFVIVGSGGGGGLDEASGIWTALDASETCLKAAPVFVHQNHPPTMTNHILKTVLIDSQLMQTTTSNNC
jgi:hypothetical protein